MRGGTASERLTWESATRLDDGGIAAADVPIAYAGAGVASVLVSADGGATWQTVAVVPNSAEWTAVSVDLSAYAGSVIQLAFDWQAADGTVGDQWSVDTVLVADAPAGGLDSAIGRWRLVIANTAGSEARGRSLPAICSTPLKSAYGCDRVGADSAR